MPVRAAVIIAGWSTWLLYRKGRWEGTGHFYLLLLGDAILI